MALSESCSQIGWQFAQEKLALWQLVRFEPWITIEKICSRNQIRILYERTHLSA